MQRLLIKRSSMNAKGFTLIEILITIMIVATLAAISMSAYIGVAKRAQRSEAYTNLETLKLLQDQRFADAATYAGDADGTANIQTTLPAFRPATGAVYWYNMKGNMRINSPNATPPTYVGETPCFTAVAGGIAGTRVAGDTFAIDCNNVRNF